MCVGINGCSQRAAIASAFDEYKGKTCVRFVPKLPAEKDHIYIKRNHAFGFGSIFWEF